MNHEPLFRIVRARPDETSLILRRTLSTRATDDETADAYAALLMHHAASLRIPMDRHWWCYAGDTPASACSALESPGRTAMLFLQPVAEDEAGVSATAHLAAAVAEEERGRGVQLLQSLLSPDDEAAARALRRAGFRYLADLLYLEVELDASRRRRSPATLAAGHALSWEHFHDARAADWESLIDSTYHGTLDCPGLTGLREIHDVLEGYRTAGRFDPKRWLIAREGREAVGCILLMESVLQPIWEVAYMGVRPESRGRGLGAALLAQGLEIAHRAGITKVRLVVDEANEPAKKMYAAAGFVEVMRRRAFILPLGASSQTI